MRKAQQPHRLITDRMGLSCSYVKDIMKHRSQLGLLQHKIQVLQAVLYLLEVVMVGQFKDLKDLLFLKEPHQQ